MVCLKNRVEGNWNIRHTLNQTNRHTKKDNFFHYLYFFCFVFGKNQPHVTTVKKITAFLRSMLINAYIHPSLGQQPRNRETTNERQPKKHFFCLLNNKRKNVFQKREQFSFCSLLKKEKTYAHRMYRKTRQ